MGIFLKPAITGMTVVLLSIGASQAETPTHESKYDKRVAAAAGKLAAAKIGNIRGSINHDQKPFITSVAVEPKTDSSKILISPSTLQTNEKPLPPMVLNVLDEIDRVITGGIKSAKPAPVDSQPRITWERFDSGGRLIKLR